MFFSPDCVPAVVSSSVDNLAFCCWNVDAVTQRLVLTGDAVADISQLFFFFSSSSIVFLSPLGQNERRGGRLEHLCVKCHGCCNDKVTADFTGKCHRGSVSPTLDSLRENTRTSQRVTSTWKTPQKPSLSHYRTPAPSAVPSGPNCHKRLYFPLPSFSSNPLLPLQSPPQQSRAPRSHCTSTLSELKMFFTM